MKQCIYVKMSLEKPSSFLETVFSDQVLKQQNYFNCGCSVFAFRR